MHRWRNIINSLLFGLVAGVGAFFLIKQSRTFFVKEGGGVGVIAEFDFADIPERLPNLDENLVVHQGDVFRGLVGPFDFDIIVN